MFFGKVYLDGIFILDGDRLTACSIERVILLNKEGKIEFLWFATQRES